MNPPRTRAGPGAPARAAADPLLDERRQSEATLDLIFQRAAHERDVPAFLSGLVRELHAAYGASGVMALLAAPGEPEGALRTVAAAGLATFDRCGGLVDPCAGALLEVLRSRVPLRVEDLALARDASLRALTARGARALVVLPLSFDDEALGLLVLLWETPLKPGDANGLPRFAERAGVTLGLVRLLSAVRESEAKYRALMEGAMDAIFLLDAESGTILACNHRAEALTSARRDTLAGRKAWELQGASGPDAVQALFRHAVEEGEIHVQDVPFTRPDGRVVRVDLSASSIPYGGRSVVQVVARDASELHDLQQRLREHATDLERRVDEKTLELRRAQAELVRSEKMAALGALVAGVAHEINTPVGSIVSNGQTIARCVEKVQEALGDEGAASLHAAHPELGKALRILDESARNTRVACDRIHGIVRNLRNFARLDEGERKTVDVHEGLESTLTLVGHMVKDRVHVVRAYGSGVPPVTCRPNELNQVFMNLLVNAAQAITGPGEVTIRTGTEDGSVTIAISDNGPGIPAALLERIFEPGFTTKPAGVGTGLGLSIVRQILEDHGGSIDVRSEPGKGSTFTVTLPAAAAH